MMLSTLRGRECCNCKLFCKDFIEEEELGRRVEICYIALWKREKQRGFQDDIIEV